MSLKSCVAAAVVSGLMVAATTVPASGDAHRILGQWQSRCIRHGSRQSVHFHQLRYHCGGNQSCWQHGLRRDVLQSVRQTRLDVVDASTTFSPYGPLYAPPATSGANVLSPGGANLVDGPDIRQRDGLDISFSTPVSAFGLDMLFESLDGFSLAGATVYGPDKTTVLYSNTFLSIPAITGGGAYFLGFVSDSAATNIGRIVFNDDDDNNVNPDANLGYDTFRFVAPTVGQVPEPTTVAVFFAGLAGLGSLRRRRKAKA